MQGTNITIPAGATLSSLASTHGVSVPDIMAANPSIKNPDVIQAGAPLTIPKPAVIQTSTSQRADTAKNISNLQGIGSNVSSQTPGAVNSDATAGNKLQEAYKENSDGTKTPVGADGKPVDTTSTPESTGTTAPGSAPFQAQIDAINAGGNDQISSLTNTLKNSLAYTDSIGAANIQNIISMYGQRMDSTKSSFDRLASSKTEIGYRTGLARYSPDQAQGVVTEVEQVEQGRLSDLIGKMNDAVTKAQGALQSGDLKTFNATSTAIAKIKEGISKSVSTLYKEAQTYESTKAKNAAASTKSAQAEISAGMKEASSVAPYLSSERANYKSDKDFGTFLEEYAKKSGIDPDVLKGAVQSYTDKGNRKATSAKDGGGQSGNFKYTGQDVSDITSILSNGGSIGGTKYSGRNTNGYTDPGLYKALAGAWEKQGGKLSDFTKQFPPEDYVNPDDNGQLPTYLQAPVKSSRSKTASSTSPFVAK